jgi:alpha-glucoside transport system substrate-binding protein
VKQKWLGVIALVAMLAVVAGCGAKSASKQSSGVAGAQKTNVSGKVSIVGVWTGPEQKAFNAVLAGFMKANPGVKVSYKSTGDNTPTVLATAVAGGNPPDLASVSQPGLVSDFQKKGALKNMDYAKSALAKNYPPDIAKLGVIKSHVYGFLIKGANKSTVWYNVKSFKNAGVKAPTTWPAFVKAAATLKASGTPAFSVGGADGWTLTDLFENIYLRQAGPAKYDALSHHTIKWTDASVVKALKTMGTILQSSNIAGGTSGALQTDFPTSVSNVFASAPKAAMVIEGDFVPGVVTHPLKAVTDYNVFDFPSINGSAITSVGGGDIVTMLKDTPASRALVTYLASPQAATIWAKRGGFSSPNKDVLPASYPDSIQRKAAVGLVKAAVFDMSDLQPAAFGSTAGQGEWKLFQDFLSSPSNVNGIASKLEAAAAKAYK